MSPDGLQEKGILNDNFPFRLLINAKQKFSWPMHWHNASEFLYVVENDFEITMNNREYELDEKDIVYIPGGKPHGFHAASTSGSRIFINFDFSVLNSYSDTNWIAIALQDAVIIKKKDNPELHDLLESEIKRIQQEYENKRSSYQLSLIARLLDSMVILYRNVTDRVSLDVDKGARKFTGIEKISKAFQYIGEHYFEEITLRDVAGAAGFSEFHFSRIFKEIANQNFRQYLIEFRLKKAQQLLMDSSTTVSTAAFSAGFSSISTFERLFKKANGCTPLEYRKMGI